MARFVCKLILCISLNFILAMIFFYEKPTETIIEHQPPPIQQEQVSPDIIHYTGVYQDFNRSLDKETAEIMALATLDAAEAFSLSPSLIAAMVLIESSGRSSAVSSCGARGLMQVRPEIWTDELISAGIILDADDLHCNRAGIYAGAYIIKQYLDKYNGDEAKALRKYSGNAKRYAEKVQLKRAEIKRGV